jgi:hypothetical protein
MKELNEYVVKPLVIGAAVLVTFFVVQMVLGIVTLNVFTVVIFNNSIGGYIAIVIVIWVVGFTAPNLPAVIRKIAQTVGESV